MGTVVDVTIPSEQFALSETFDAVPEVEFETVRVAAHAPSGAMPFVWGFSSDPDHLEEVLGSDGTTDQVTQLASDGGRALYRIKWGSGVMLVIEMFAEANGSLLGVRGENGAWELRILFPDRESVSVTYERWRNRGIDPSIRRVHDVSQIVTYGGAELSPCQHEALVEAFETDYYDVPRGVTLDRLADQLDVSHQALSERLRRGHRNLIETTLCSSPGTLDR